jgi:hypothetical protein
MAWYRIGAPGQDTAAHVDFARGRRGPAPCKARALEGDNLTIGAGCFRASVALCDAPAGADLDGSPLTCDMPICEHHRTRGARPNVDYCPRHAHLAAAAEARRA